MARPARVQTEQHEADEREPGQSTQERFPSPVVLRRVAPKAWESIRTNRNVTIIAPAPRADDPIGRGQGQGSEQNEQPADVPHHEREGDRPRAGLRWATSMPAKTHRPGRRKQIKQAGADIVLLGFPELIEEKSGEHAQAREGEEGAERHTPPAKPGQKEVDPGGTEQTGQEHLKRGRGIRG